MKEPSRLQQALRSVDREDEPAGELETSDRAEASIGFQIEDAVAAAIAATAIEAGAELDEAIERTARQITREAIRRVQRRLIGIERRDQAEAPLGFQKGGAESE